MTRDLRIRHLKGREPIEERFTEAVAFFGVKLDTHDVAASDRARKCRAVSRRCPDMIVVIAAHAITVGEIKALFLAIQGQQRVIPHRGRDVPPHMRNQHPIRATIQVNDIGRDYAETLRAAFLASATKQLHAKADPKQRMPAGNRITDESNEAALLQCPRTEVKGTDARQDQPVPPLHWTRRADQLGINAKTPVHGY